MTEEETTLETVEPTEPEPTPEPDPSEEIKAREEAIAKRERELQKGFDEVARRKRELEEAPAPADEELPELPEETAKVLDKYFDAKYGSKIKAVDNLYADLLDTELAKREDPDAIREVIAEYGFVPKDDSIAAIREVFDKAESVAKAKSLNPEAERERIRAEERKAILEELAADGVHIETIEPKRSETSPEVSLDDDDLDSETRVRLLREKHPHLSL